MGILLTPQQLASRLKDPGIIVLDATMPPVGVTPPVDTHARYLAKHIPGAAFFDIEALSHRETHLPHMLPRPEEFARAMSGMGVGSDMGIVLYEQEGVFSAPRAWWMLKTFGADEVHILDGGLNAWVDAGLPTHSGYVNCKPARFTVHFDPGAVVDFDELQELLEDGDTQVLDARSNARFSGAAPEPRPGLPSGHMPGAVSIPFTDLTENGRLKTKDQLKDFFHEKGVDPKKPIVTTCGSGVTAAVISLALETIGAKHVRVYDGAWAEYAQHPDAKIVKDI